MSCPVDDYLFYREDAYICRHSAHLRLHEAPPTHSVTYTVAATRSPICVLIGIFVVLLRMKDGLVLR